MNTSGFYFSVKSKWAAGRQPWDGREMDGEELVRRFVSIELGVFTYCF
jgi:hypothetical protein